MWFYPSIRISCLLSPCFVTMQYWYTRASRELHRSDKRKRWWHFYLFLLLHGWVLWQNLYQHVYCHTTPCSEGRNPLPWKLHPPSGTVVFAQVSVLLHYHLLGIAEIPHWNLHMWCVTTLSPSGDSRNYQEIFTNMHIAILPPSGVTGTTTGYSVLICMALHGWEQISRTPHI